MRTRLFGAAALALVAAIVGSTAGTANAALIGLTSKKPDVYSNQVWMTYTVTDAVNHYGTLTAGGSASILTPPIGSATSINSGTFALTAYLHYGALSTDPVTAVGGSLQITGDTGSGIQTLLSGSNISQFGYSTSKATFDFLFAPGAGSLDTWNGPVGVILHEEPIRTPVISRGCSPRTSVLPRPRPAMPTPSPCPNPPRPRFLALR